MKIATWNVNSIRAREERVGAWLESRKPDVVCLQETKVQDDIFPRELFTSRGYEVEIYGQKTYNGVAIASRHPIENVERGLCGEDEETQRRVIEATVGGVRLVDVYVPNGSEVGSDKFVYKLGWLDRLKKHLAERYDPQTESVLVLGDFNIAPEDRDVYDPEAFRGKVLFHEDEHARLGALMDWGLVDVFRNFHEEDGLFSWWDYRAAMFRRGLGLRIDLLLATRPLAERMSGSEIDREERKGQKPSDHAPVIVEFE